VVVHAARIDLRGAVRAQTHAPVRRPSSAPVSIETGRVPASIDQIW